MKDADGAMRMDLRRVRDWLTAEVAVRLPRAWLVIGGALGVVLLIVAFD